MKQLKSTITSIISPEVIAEVTKTKTTCSPFYGGNCYAELNVRIESGMKKEWQQKIDEKVKRIQELQKNTVLETYQTGDVQYNINLNETIDTKIMLKTQVNVQGSYAGVIEINKRPYFRGSALIGPKH